MTVQIVAIKDKNSRKLLGKFFQGSVMFVPTTVLKDACSEAW